MSTRRLIFWSILWAFPLQYFFFLVLQIYWWKSQRFDDQQYPHSGAYGCSNFFQLGMSHCTLPEMLGTPLYGIFFGNIFLVGLPSLFSALVVAGALVWWRSYKSRQSGGASEVLPRQSDGPAA